MASGGLRTVYTNCTIQYNINFFLVISTTIVYQVTPCHSCDMSDMVEFQSPVV